MASGISLKLLQNICTQNLEHLTWTVNAKQNGGHLNQDESIFKGPLTSSRFDNLTQLSLQLIVKSSQENCLVFTQLLREKFLKLYSLTMHTVSEWNADLGSSDLTRDTMWTIYFETFNFISRHSKTLRILGLDYSHLNLNMNHPQHSWLWALHQEKVKAVSFNQLKLYQLQFYCPDKEGTLPWVLGSSLLSSQKELSQLSVKTYGNPCSLDLEGVLNRNRKLKLFYFANPQFNSTFDLCQLKQHKELRELELVYNSGLVNSIELTKSIQKLKLRTVYTITDLIQILKKCQKLKTLSLPHNGCLWDPLTLDTFKICLENSSSLKYLYMDYFEVNNIVQFCEQREDLKLSIRRKNKGKLRIKSN